MLHAWTSQTFSRRSSLSFIASSRSSKLHLLFIQSCCEEVLAGRPTQVCPCEGVHWRPSHEFILVSPAVYRMCFLAYLDGFRDRR